MGGLVGKGCFIFPPSPLVNKQDTLQLEFSNVTISASLVGVHLAV